MGIVLSCSVNAAGIPPLYMQIENIYEKNNFKNILKLYYEYIIIEHQQRLDQLSYDIISGIS